MRLIKACWSCTCGILKSLWVINKYVLYLKACWSFYIWGILKSLKQSSDAIAICRRYDSSKPNPYLSLQGIVQVFSIFLNTKAVFTGLDSTCKEAFCSFCDCKLVVEPIGEHSTVHSIVSFEDSQCEHFVELKAVRLDVLMIVPLTVRLNVRLRVLLSVGLRVRLNVRLSVLWGVGLQL